MGDEPFVEPDFKTLFESAPGLYLVLDPDLRIVAASEAYLEATLTRRADILGRYVFDVFPDNPGDPSANAVANFTASFNRVLRFHVTDSVGLQRHDVRRPEAEGGGWEERYWSATNAPILGAESSLAYILHRVENVTELVHFQQKSNEQASVADVLRAQVERMRGEIAERRRAEEALREHELKYRILADNTHDWECWLDPEGRFVYCSPACERFTGHAAEEFLADPGLRARTVHSDDRPGFENHVRHVEQERAGGEGEWRVVRPDGTWRWVAHACHPVFDPQGRYLGLRGSNRDITERKQAEARVSRSAKTFSELVERAPFGIYIVDSQFRIAQMNAGSQAGAFRNVRPVIGRDFAEATRILWPEPVAAEIIAAFRHTLETGEPYYSPRFTNPRHDIGAVESYEWELHRMTLPDGQHGVICYYFDSTELRQTEAALRESEERLRFALESSGTGAWDLDLTDQTAYRSLEHDRIFGYATPLPRWTYDMFLEHVLREDRAAVDAKFRHAIETHSDWSFESRIRRADGEERWIWAAGRHWSDAAGGPRRMAGIVQDITERKRAEEEVRRSREDLDRAQAVGQIGWWRLDTRRNVLTWSDENYRIFGVPPGTPLTYETFLGIVHPDDRAYVDTRWNAGLRGEPYDIEHRIVANGRVKWVREKAYLEWDDSGALLGGFGITQDITERKNIEEERAEQARRKDEFLALLGHELRNPLATISTAMHLLSGGVSAERRDILNGMMERQVGVLRRLVDDLLDLARIMRGQIELQKERVDLGDFLHRVSVAVRTAVAARGQELVVRMPAGQVVFSADGVRLEQVVANLLSNASKYTPAGGRIELGGAKEGSEVVIRCKDNGRGIPPGMQRMIFEPFTRVELASRSEVPGAGLGLALVKQLVELHGGTVSVESGGPGMGSEFTVRLPLVEPPAAPRGASGPLPAPRVRRALSVVIVEDSPDVAQTTAIALEQAGHRVTSFSDGPSALSGLARMRPDALLLDIGLPGMDGYELAAKLRKKRSFQQTLFVGLSGFKRRPLVENGKDVFDQYFVKPVDLDRLLSLLDTAGRQKRQRVRGNPAAEA